MSDTFQMVAVSRKGYFFSRNHVLGRVIAVHILYSFLRSFTRDDCRVGRDVYWATVLTPTSSSVFTVLMSLPCLTIFAISSHSVVYTSSLDGVLPCRRAFPPGLE